MKNNQTYRHISTTKTWKGTVQNTKFQNQKPWGRQDKPVGGFWLAAVENGRSEWETWCDQEQPDYINGNPYADYMLAEGAKVLCIESVEDSMSLPKNADGSVDWHAISCQYDALWMGHDEARYYQWDIASLVVFNADALVKVDAGVSYADYSAYIYDSAYEFDDDF